MSAEKKPALEGGQAALQDSADKNSSHAWQHHEPKSDLLTDEEILASISANDRDYQLWLNGYLYGQVHGATEQRLNDTEVAELAARIAVANVENHAEVRSTIRQAISFIDVAAARAKTRSGVEQSCTYGGRP